MVYNKLTHTNIEHNIANYYIYIWRNFCNIRLILYLYKSVLFILFIKTCKEAFTPTRFYDKIGDKSNFILKIGDKSNFYFFLKKLEKCAFTRIRFSNARFLFSIPIFIWSIWTYTNITQENNKLNNNYN